MVRPSIPHGERAIAKVIRDEVSKHERARKTMKVVFGQALRAAPVRILCPFSPMQVHRTRLSFITLVFRVKALCVNVPLAGFRPITSDFPSRGALQPCSGESGGAFTFSWYKLIPAPLHNRRPLAEQISDKIDMNRVWSFIGKQFYRPERLRKMKAGIGFCNDPDAFESGRSIAEQALSNGNLEKPDLVLAFCSGRVDADGFFEGLRAPVGPEVPIIGGSAVGIITNNELSYEGFPAGAAVLQMGEVSRRFACANELDQDEYGAGRSLGEQLSNGAEDRLLLIFYDSVKTPPVNGSPPVMNASPPLIRGIEEAFGAGLPIVGGGVLGDYEFSPPRQFCGSFVDRQSMVGALFGGNIEPHVRIMHGCTPKDGIYHTITRIEGPVVYELDGKPIVEMIDGFYGGRSWRGQRPVKRLAIGVNYGDRYGDLREDRIVTRLFTGVLPGGDGVALFEPDLEEGMEILFMLRDGRTMIESARCNSLGLMQRIGQARKTPRLALYIDCAGRTADHSETLTEEACEVQTVLNEHSVPLLGFFSGVEVAPLLGKSRGLDWTGVLLVLTEG